MTQWNVKPLANRSSVSERTINSTAASLLGFLIDGPLTGWDLVAAAQEMIGDFWTLTRSQVYREVHALAASGYVEALEPGPRDRRPYALTAAGRAAFQEWIECEPGLETIRVPLLLTIGFGRYLPPERLAEFVASHRRAHAERLRRYEAAARDEACGDDVYARATLDFGIAHERAALRWFEELPEAIRGDGG